MSLHGRLRWLEQRRPANGQAHCQCPFDDSVYDEVVRELCGGEARPCARCGLWPETTLLTDAERAW